MPKGTTPKNTAARPPYKVKSAGTKTGILPDSSEDSTPTPQALQASTMTEEQPAESIIKISRQESVEKDIPGKVGDELLPKAASKGDAGASAPTKQTPEGKEPLQGAETMPARATERGSGQSQPEVCEQSCGITNTCDCDGWVPDERFEQWVVGEVEARAAEAGMSTGDWIASECGDYDWYPYEEGAFDGMAKDDADAKMAQIFRSYGQ
ncbi:uncharacterized protein EDB93DRAFT_277175 [Suillus bovinus]|uniref:uncharacterized protein n=1 Tax=Suillus bovinus TaxID=48563 RepID=UPI001B8749BE|nr:uncharacterized protein EDB93DRAFT_277175 [Suillus bovinus]KAG2159279.1 hypothetical protein EDB93DRAFT_277175 [Suillus bovinus]